MMASHQTAIASLATRIAKLYDAKIPLRVYHGSTNTTHKSSRNNHNAVDISGLNKVLSIDLDAKTIVTEPNVPMDNLIQYTLKHSLIPLVVMEFPGITSGGGFSGTSAESSSFKHGLFETTVNWIEIILANGEIRRASRTESPDLFWGAASSFGTLGVITALEIRLKAAKPFVALTYNHFSSITQTTVFLQEQSKNPAVDYLDGITYATNSIVVCAGRLVDIVPDGQVSCQFRRRRDPWFYLHVDAVRQSLLGKSASVHVDYVPLVDYLFRYDRGGFWVGKYAFEYFATPFNDIIRALLDPFMHTRIMYKALHKSGMIDYYLIQDVYVPYDAVEEFIEWLNIHFGLQPLWLCPLRVSRDAEDSEHGMLASFGQKDTASVLNIGIWGPLSWNREEAIARNRQLEQKLAKIRGKKWMYGQGYATEAEFWANYDRSSYNALRRKFHADVLPNIYDKVNVNIEAERAAINTTWLAMLVALFWNIWPIRGLCGVYHAVFKSDYLLQRPTSAIKTRLKCD